MEPLKDYSFFSIDYSENPGDLTRSNMNFLKKIKKWVNKWRKPKSDFVNFKISQNEVKINRPKNDNLINSQKYTWYNFVPIVLFNEFKVFYNFYFLLICLSYFVPVLRVGVWWANWIPLLLCVIVSFVKEVMYEYQCKMRDKKMNEEIFEVMKNGEAKKILSKDIKPGDFVVLKQGCRVPADMLIVATSQKNKRKIFLKTDQLDGETDWKLKIPFLPYNMEKFSLILEELDQTNMKISLPSKNIDHFEGMVELKNGTTEMLSMDSVAFANSTVATGNAIGFVLYTGDNTKSSLNLSPSFYKMGVFESEANVFAILLFLFQSSMALFLGLSASADTSWYINVGRFILLLSYVLPVSLRINLDMGKFVYAKNVKLDKKIKGAAIQNANICEELGRISYVLTDKTGTLTENNMKFKKIKTENNTFNSVDIQNIFADISKRQQNEQLEKLIYALAVCNNVTPVEEEVTRTYQGSSTDEIALVNFAKSVGFELVSRDMNKIVLSVPFSSSKRTLKIIRHFPFTSKRKRSGILLQDEESKQFTFFIKGSEEVIGPMAAPSNADWLDSETTSLASEGLRVLVYARKTLDQQAAAEFCRQYDAAAAEFSSDREAILASVVQRFLESDLELLGATGVEDKLCPKIKMTVETLRQAGISVWMVTGDKVETAVCIGKAAGLISRHSVVLKMTREKDVDYELFGKLVREKTVVIIDGKTLQNCFDNYKDDFMNYVKRVESLIICRSSPQQKAQIVAELKRATAKRVLAVGDGGNDVGMIKAADVGVGIDGVEGRSAAAAADVAVMKFSHLARVILWHGRNFYIRSGKLAKLIFHRGVILSVIQAIYSIMDGYKTLPVFPHLLIIFYTTCYTSMPIFSIVGDCDISEKNIMLFPQFYEYVQNSDIFSMKSFFGWLFKSFYQSVVIFFGSTILLKNINQDAMLNAFSCLVVVELVNIGMEIHHWEIWAFLSFFISFLMFFGTLVILHLYLGYNELFTTRFFIILTAVTLLCCVPVIIFKFLWRRSNPSPNPAAVFEE